jgi:CheY-like chemotaxis protein
VTVTLRARHLGDPLRPVEVPGNSEQPPRIQLVRDGVPVRALVCDDEPDVRKSLKATLERRGAIVVAVENGAEGLRLARSQPFDVIVTDFLMPEMNGVELIQQLRAHGVGVPVLFISGFIGDPAALAGIPADVPKLQKPFVPATLVALVAELTAVSPPK